MKRHNEAGAINVLLIPLILSIVLFIVAVIFGYWAFSGRQDYKNHVAQKVDVAVAANTKKVQATDAANYAEQAKQPLKSYQGPAEYGSLKVMYPKTWSAYVDETGNGQATVDGYFNPGFVPALNDQNSVFALRVQILSQSYSQVMQQYAGSVQRGDLKSKPYSFPKVKSVIGTRLDGAIANNKQGSMVIVPFRAGSLEISTESQQFEHDFDTYILPNVTFTP